MESERNEEKSGWQRLGAPKLPADRFSDIIGPTQSVPAARRTHQTRFIRAIEEEHRDTTPFPSDHRVRYDNERGRGDHRHVDGVEQPYRFESLSQVLDDFQRDVENWR